MSGSIVKRGLPTRKLLQARPDVVEVFRHALLYDRAEGTWEFNKEGKLCQTNEAINDCYRNGWLQAELAELEDEYDEGTTIYVFASVLHRR